MPCSSTSQLTNASTPVLPLTQPTTPAQWNYFVARLQDIINAVSGAANRQPVNVVPVAYAVYNGSSLPALTVTGATAALDATKAQFGNASLKLTATAATVTVSFTGNPIVIQPFARWIESVYITSSRTSITGTLAVVTAVKSYPVDISGTLIPATWGRLYGDCDLTADDSTAATLTLTLTGCAVGDTFNLEGWQLEQSAGTSLPSPFVNTAAPATLDALPDGITRYGAAYPAAVQSGMYGPGANLILNPSFQLGMMDWALAGGPPSWSAASALGEPCALINPNATPTTAVASSNVVTGLAAGVALSASIEVALNANLTGGDVSADVQFQNSGGTSVGASARLFTINGTFSGFLRRTLNNIICPANTAQAYIRYYTENATATAAAIRIRRVKLELGATATPFNDAATQRGNKLTQTGSGQTIGDQRNAPSSLTSNIGIVRSATALTAHAGGAVDVNAHSIQLGSATINYNAVTNAVTGLANSVGYYIYTNDNYAGGTQTWNATTSATTANNADERYNAGFVTIPTGGISSGGGCVCSDMWLRPGLTARVLAERWRWWKPWLWFLRGPDGWHLVRRRPRIVQELCVRAIVTDGSHIDCSTSTPVTTQTGESVQAPLLYRHMIATENGWQRVIEVESLPGLRDVVRICCGGHSFFAGADKYRRISTHNGWKP